MALLQDHAIVSQKQIVAAEQDHIGTKRGVVLEGLFGALAQAAVQMGACRKIYRTRQRKILNYAATFEEE